MARRKRAVIKLLSGILLGFLFTQFFCADDNEDRFCHNLRKKKTQKPERNLQTQLDSQDNRQSVLNQFLTSGDKEDVPDIDVEYLEDFFEESENPSRDSWLWKYLPFGSQPSKKNLRRKSRLTNDLIFVGVMTASKYLNTRAKAVYDTWGRHLPGKLLFFSSEHSHLNNHHNLPVISLPGIDDSYPPQKKSFAMLKYIHDNYLNRYEWFLRADDDVYVRTDRLETLLRSVDSRTRPWFIGQTGRGGEGEAGTLSLESDENFCMGGPGVIMSRETLRRLAPYVGECLGRLYTSHEDVELGRCVRRFAGVSCTWSYEMQVILYHNQSGEAAFSGNLKQKEVHRAITMHPVKRPENMYRLHKYIQGLKIQSNLQETLNLHRDIATSMRQLGVTLDGLQKSELVPGMKLFPEPEGSKEYLGDPTKLGVPIGLNRFHPTNLVDLLEWELIAKSSYSSLDLNPRRRIATPTKEGLDDVIRDVMDAINAFSKQRGRVIDFKEILYGYHRLDPVNGVDLILDVLLVYRKYRGHKMTVHVRRHAYLQQTFTGVYVREVEMEEEEEGRRFTDFFKSLPKIMFVRDESREGYVNFVLPLSGRYATFERFLYVYVENCVKTMEMCRLIVVLYKNPKSPEDYNKTTQLIERTKNNYKTHKFTVITISEPFSRGRALQYAVNSTTTKPNDLLFFIDVDITFDHSTLYRIKHNTIQNKQIYFPIVFSTYDPRVSNVTSQGGVAIDGRVGFWRQFGFGVVGVYKSDYLALGGFNTSISGWGVEDVAFYDAAVRSDLKLVRCADPGLVHLFHDVECGGELEVAQRNMCFGTRASTFGSLEELQVLYGRLFR